MRKKVKLFKEINKDFFEGQNLFSSLLRIKGIGAYKALLLTEKVNVSYNKKIQELTTQELEKIEKELLSQTIEKSLITYIKERIEYQKALVSYKGFRHVNRLKVRGQKTKSTGRKTKKAKGKK